MEEQERKIIRSYFREILLFSGILLGLVFLGAYYSSQKELREALFGLVFAGFILFLAIILEFLFTRFSESYRQEFIAKVSGYVNLPVKDKIKRRMKEMGLLGVGIFALFPALYSFYNLELLANEEFNDYGQLVSAIFTVGFYQFVPIHSPGAQLTFLLASLALGLACFGMLYFMNRKMSAINSGAEK